jgi:hypothetical protein
VGEYGVGTECKPCGTDLTSPAKSDDRSDCVKGNIRSYCTKWFFIRRNKISMAGIEQRAGHLIPTSESYRQLEYVLTRIAPAILDH